ncbi:DUF427 domain-containing protein [Myxosarcina sp. GI1]|uniref:DUF427 domain-containing protein n=1 Tax=Myxosarcina sp. GI1 TaxID=1541065 RepID=UPI00056B083A|nr:DUF427 domain-containing protein [Myxosarcina sp. GI1]
MAAYPQRIEPQPGQESVWDYPRPPRLERSPKRIKVIFNGVTIADSCNAYRVLETSHPPTYYIPPEDIQKEHFQQVPAKRSFCEWKGVANYYTIIVGDKQATSAAWYYLQPNEAFAPIKNYVAVYPSRMDACYVDEELVRSQAGDFYGGWITSDIVGPFKGEVGTRGW